MSRGHSWPQARIAIWYSALPPYGAAGSHVRRLIPSATKCAPAWAIIGRLEPAFPEEPAKHQPSGGVRDYHEPDQSRCGGTDTRVHKRQVRRREGERMLKSRSNKQLDLEDWRGGLAATLPDHECHASPPRDNLLCDAAVEKPDKRGRLGNCTTALSRQQITDHEKHNASRNGGEQPCGQGACPIPPGAPPL